MKTLDAMELANYDSVIEARCECYDFESDDAPWGFFRVIRIVKDSDLDDIMVDFPARYRKAHPECGEVVAMGSCSLVIDDLLCEPDEFYASPPANPETEDAS